jgi:hypothetical protein
MFPASREYVTASGSIVARAIASSSSAGSWSRCVAQAVGVALAALVPMLVRVASGGRSGAACLAQAGPAKRGGRRQQDGDEHGERGAHGRESSVRVRVVGARKWGAREESV